MIFRKGEGLAAAATAHEPHQIPISGQCNERSDKPSLKQTQAPITAELSGSDTCTTGGITVRGYAPALALCRELLRQRKSIRIGPLKYTGTASWPSASEASERAPATPSRTTGSEGLPSIAARMPL